MSTPYEIVDGIVVAQGPPLPPGLWDDPLPEDAAEFIEFYEAWFNPEPRQNYELSALSYDSYDCEFWCPDSPCGCGDGPPCDADGAEIREFVEYGITQNGDDGSYSALFGNQFSEDAVEFGHYVISESGTMPDKGSWFTFRNVALNSSMRIRKAQIRFVAANDGGTPDIYQGVDDTEVTISGHCSAGTARVPTFSDQPSDTMDQGGGLDSYWPRTATQIGWNRPGVTSEDVFYTPNVACVVQELIGRQDWQSGDDITLFIDACLERPHPGLNTVELHQVYDYSDDPTKSAVLQIWYSFSFTEPVQGGLRGGGSATVQYRARPTVSGGVVVSGSGIHNPQIIMEGGVLGGGNADYGRTYSERMQGGVVVNGEAIHNAALPMLGGLVGGGTAHVTSAETRTPEGGVLVGGNTRFANGFYYRVAITVPPRGEELRSFPLRVAIGTETDDETEVLFTDTENNVLAHKLIEQEGERINAVVEVTLDATETTVVWMYYGGVA